MELVMKFHNGTTIFLCLKKKRKEIKKKEKKERKKEQPQTEQAVFHSLV